LFLLLVVVFAFPLAAQVNDTYVIPAVGNIAGANGTVWASDLNIFNPQPYPLKVTLVYLPLGGEAGKTVRFTVDSNSNAVADNVLREVFDVAGTGSLLVATLAADNPGVENDPVARAFLVTSATYNNAHTGTYGQAVPPLWAGLQDYSDLISAVANGVRNDSTGFTGFRANIGAVNLGRFSAKMRVWVYDSLGNTIARDIPYTIPPQGYIADRLPVMVDRGSVEFFVDDPYKDAVVFPYVSVIDNRSGDPQYFNPTLLAVPSILYKGAMAAKPVGKKIDSAIAQRVISTTRDLGEATVVRALNGENRISR
jgi:hypothetical protein